MKREKFKPKPILTNTKRRLFKLLLFLATPLLIALGIITQSRMTLNISGLVATISLSVLFADLVVRRRTVGNSSVGKNPTATQRRNLR